MSKPNSERRRINVDVGERCWYFLDELLRAVPAAGQYGSHSTVSGIVRLAIEEFAKDRLRPAQLHLAPVPDGDLNCQQKRRYTGCRRTAGTLGIIKLGD